MNGYLPSELLCRAIRRDGEYSWRWQDSIHAASAAEKSSIACAGGKAKFRSPDGRYEIIWSSFTTDGRRWDESWDQYVARSWNEARRISHMLFSDETTVEVGKKIFKALQETAQQEILPRDSLWITLTFQSSDPADEITPLNGETEPLELSGFEAEDVPNSQFENLPLEDRRPRDPERMGWVSPRYSLSRSVELVPETVLDNRCVAFSTPSPELESYRLLRTRIMARSRVDGGNTLMVTSAIPGEGKTLTAINLAMTFAREFDQTVLLVDCDLRQQKVHKVLGYESYKGLTDFLVDAEPLSNLIVWPGIEKMTVISGERTLDAGSEYLGSPGMKALVHEMKSRYPDRFIIFDVPPLLTVADSLALVPSMDYVLMVVRADHTQARDIEKALKMVQRDKLVGTVLNRAKSKPSPYYGAPDGEDGRIARLLPFKLGRKNGNHASSPPST
jgi:protein-tyrosine kinase